MIGKSMDAVLKPVAKVLERNRMGALGVNNTTALAKAYNSLRFGSNHQSRKMWYRKNFSELIAENGNPVAPVNEMKDGWVIDTSGRLPYLEELIRESAEIIDERGGEKHQFYKRPFFQDLFTEDYFSRCPSILNFATSSDVLTTVCGYMGFIPTLSYSQPYGVRLIESWSKFDDTPDAPPRESQLFHLDYHDKPMVYAIVVLREVTMERGPFCFLPKSVSARAEIGLGDYHTRKGGHRVTDGNIYSVVPEGELIRLCYPAGTVLFLDSSACFHYGSRNAVKPRHLMMFAYVSTIRTDFGDIVLRNMRYPVRKEDSRLRRMVLDKEYI
ncbi:MAG: hypothetical protein ACREOP_08815 [Thermodesulfobacteriota bacterium]